jgi:hypothetical protein
MTAKKWAEMIPNHTPADPLDQLMDMACGLPAVLEATEKLQSEPEPEPPEHDQATAIQALTIILQNIYIWQFELRQSSSSPLYTTTPSQLVGPVDQAYGTKTFPFAINFRSIQVASCLTVSWAIQLQVHYTLLRLCATSELETLNLPADFSLHSTHGSNQKEQGEASTNPSNSIRVEADRLARCLCQSIEYCHRVEMGTFGPQTMLYSQWVMRQYFQHVGAERELLWCRNVEHMHGTGARFGIKMMAFQG